MSIVFMFICEMCAYVCVLCTYPKIQATSTLLSLKKNKEKSEEEPTNAGIGESVCRDITRDGSYKWEICYTEKSNTDQKILKNEKATIIPQGFHEKINSRLTGMLYLWLIKANHDFITTFENSVLQLQAKRDVWVFVCISNQFHISKNVIF